MKLPWKKKKKKKTLMDITPRDIIRVSKKHAGKAGKFVLKEGVKFFIGLKCPFFKFKKGG